MKLFCSIYFFLFSFYLFSQKNYSNEILFENDNDLYVSTKSDRYYTNGLFVKYRYLIKPKKYEKRIFEWEIGHKMYTPYKAIVTSIEEHDRPFAAYLYSGFKISRIYKNKRILNTKIEIGTIGPEAKGKELQNLIHDIYEYANIDGWKYQISNAFAFNFNTEYISPLSKKELKKFDVFWTNEARLGTVFTDLNSGLLLRLGFKPLLNSLNSVSFGSHLNYSNKEYLRKMESFLFFKPSLSLVFYDATLQGSFLNSNSLVTSEINPIVFNLSVGFKVTSKRFNFSYTFNYNTNKSRDLKMSNGYKYGSISLGYLLN